MTRAQSGNTSRQLSEANRLIAELRQNKHHDENTIRNLNHAQRRQDEDLRKKEYHIQRLNLRNRHLEGHKKQLEKERNEWREEAVNYDYIVNGLLKPYAAKNKVAVDALPGESLKNALHAIIHDLKQGVSLRKEVQHLQSQVQGLQRDMLAKVDKVYVISDDQFAKEFRSLASSIKSLSRSVPVIAGIDIASVRSSFVLLKDVAPDHWDGRARRKALMEALIWSILLSLVFNNPYAFFGTHCKALNEAWIQVFGANHPNGWPKPSLEGEGWRVKTVEHLVSQTSRDIITHGKPEHMLEGLTASVIQARMLAATYIAGNIETQPPGDDALQVQVQLIVEKAFALAMQISLQRSRIQVTYPAIGAAFHKEQTLPAEQDDDEDMGQGVVAFIINPGLTKWGDVHGKNFDDRYDIVPSLVQLV